MLLFAIMIFMILAMCPKAEWIFGQYKVMLDVIAVDCNKCYVCLNKWLYDHIVYHIFPLSGFF